MEIENTKAQMRKGVLEFCILCVLSEKDAYPSEIIEAMKDAKGELSITSKKVDDGQLLVSVSDSGIGLPGGEADRIFEAFFTTKAQGTGMGLSISRRIIESHGGSLWASANPGRGATFQFTLPSDMARSAIPAA